jgi:hypothetical protein
MMRTYGVASYLDEYHDGSRQWMYDRVDEWLDNTLKNTDEAKRLFLLLADAVTGLNGRIAIASRSFCSPWDMRCS